MMTFPGPSKEQIKFFEDQRKRLTQSFLTSPDIRELVKDEKELAALNGLYDVFSRAAKENNTVSLANSDKRPLFSLVRAAFFLESERFTKQEIDDAH